MDILQRMFKLLNAYCDYSAKTRSVIALSQLTNEQLDDVGISRRDLNHKMTALWTSGERLVPATKKTRPSVSKAAKKPSSVDFSRHLVSLYSLSNRTGYVV
ncbi:MAG: DUF1127 domain-containing protein [Thiolinea sp.]